MKTRTWYSTKIIPDRKQNLIVMTDMGFVFQAVYENGKFYTFNCRDNKMYLEVYENQDSLIKWMKY